MIILLAFVGLFLGGYSGFISQAAYADDQQMDPESSIEPSIQPDIQEDLPDNAWSYSVPTDVAPGRSVDFPSVEDPSFFQRFGMSYFGVLFGPALRNATAYQPTPFGTPDKTKPIIMKNFLSLSYGISENIAASVTGYWIWQPVLGQQIYWQDPFVRLSYNSIFNSGGWNLYGDIRIHPSLTSISRQNQLYLGVQSFQALTYEFSGTRLMLGLYASERTNFFGPKGYGSDFEFYLAPNLMYQISPTVAFSLLYEAQAFHRFGDKVGRWYNDGSGLEPGLTWQVTPRVTLNPYLHISTGGIINMKSTSFGMWLNWVLL